MQLNSSLPAAAMSCLSGVISSAFTCYIWVKKFHMLWQVSNTQISW